MEFLELQPSLLEIRSNPVEAMGGVFLSGLMTFLLVCSSVTMVMSIDSCKRADREGMLKWLLFTIIGGAIFLMRLHDICMSTLIWLKTWNDI